MSADPGIGKAAAQAADDFALRGDHITLDALLKAAGIAASGGDAKALIAAGGARVNGEVELRRGRKLRAGDLVVVAARQLRVVPGGPDRAPD